MTNEIPRITFVEKESANKGGSGLRRGLLQVGEEGVLKQSLRKGGEKKKKTKRWGSFFPKPIRDGGGGSGRKK